MSTIKVGTLLAADGSTTTQPSIPALDQRMATAWVNFNGTSTVAIRDSYNVSSITDNGTGDYSVTYTNAMSNSNYATAASILGSQNCDGMTVGGIGGSGTFRSTSFTRFRIFYGPSNSTSDLDFVQFIVLGGQA